MFKKIGTLALLYGFFLSSASFAPWEEGAIARQSHGDRQVSALSTGGTKEKRVDSYSKSDFASYNDCMIQLRYSKDKQVCKKLF